MLLLYLLTAGIAVTSHSGKDATASASGSPLGIWIVAEFPGTYKTVSRDVFGCRLCHASTPIAMIGKALISFNIFTESVISKK